MDGVFDCVVGYGGPFVIVVIFSYLLPMAFVYIPAKYVKYIPLVGLVLAIVGSYACMFEFMLFGFTLVFSGLITMYKKSVMKEG